MSSSSPRRSLRRSDVRNASRGPLQPRSLAASAGSLPPVGVLSATTSGSLGPEQWSEVSSRLSPALLGSGPLDAGARSASSWFAASSGSLLSSPERRQPCWRPLGAAWREWEHHDGEPSRTDVCDGSAFVKGCLPQWGAEITIRVKGALSHELTWAYYRMKRHPEHPVRKDITQQFPPWELQGVNFWQDLRPPFVVKKVRRVDESDSGLKGLHHPDGDLHLVSYDCGLDYAGERKFDTMPGSSTFDSKIHGIAKVRFGNLFPSKRNFHFVSWGTPVVCRSPGQAGEAEARDKEKMQEVPDVVDARVWNPLATELAVRPDSLKLARVHSEIRSMHARSKASGPKPLQLSKQETMLLGPHVSMQLQAPQSPQPRAERDGNVKLRHHRIATSAAGFLKYAG